MSKIIELTKKEKCSVCGGNDKNSENTAEPSTKMETKLMPLDRINYSRREPIDEKKPAAYDNDTAFKKAT